MSIWRAIPNELLEYKPHDKTNSLRTILTHQLLSERRFFAQFVGTEEPPVEDLLPLGDKPTVQDYIDKYVWLARRRLPQFAAGTAEWWLEARPFFGGLQRQRIWIFWRRSLAHRATIEPKCKRGCASPVTKCRPSTVHRATSHGTRPIRRIPSMRPAAEPKSRARSKRLDFFHHVKPLTGCAAL